MRRFVGWFFIAHAIGHAYIGTVALNVAGLGMGIGVWSVALLGFVGAGLGLLRLPYLRNVWQPLTFIAATASIALCLWASALWPTAGFAIDIVILVLVFGIAPRTFESDIEAIKALGPSSFRHPTAVKLGWTLGTVAPVYVAAVIFTRPVALRWGTAEAEREASLPGDEVFPDEANYRIDHGITVHASPSAIWPWLMQLGQDRGGFYSYDWLERGFGADIRNADRVHPEWQSRSIGDTVFATQSTYFGGRLGRLGWRVNALEAEKVIGLEKWGTFVLRPIDSANTRLLVRTRGDAALRLPSFVFAPVDVFIFEPAHFIMERAVLRGIRDRVERHSKVWR